MISFFNICVLVFLGLSVSRCMSEKETNNDATSNSETEVEQPQAEKQQDKIDDSDNYYFDDEETDDSNLGTNKRMHFGTVLGKGFSFGKRFGSILGKGFSLGKRFGYVLGKGYGFGKKYSNGFDSGMPARSRWTLDDYIWDNDGISFDGTKRSSDFDNIAEDFEFVDLDGPVDEKRKESDEEYDFENNKRSKRDLHKRRFIQYYGNLLGRGLSVGRRSNEEMGENVGLINPYEEFDGGEGNPAIEKRLYSNILGRGYMFGKRRSNADRRRYFGNMLGRGFSFGKRSDNEEQYDTVDDTVSFERAGNKQQLDDEEIAAIREELSALKNSPSKRYIMSSPEHRFSSGKRFGYILGHGFSFGKRGFITPNQSKRPYGFMLGRGLTFGKRSPEVLDEIPGMDNHFTAEQLSYNPELENYQKRAGYLLGKGYLFGKRGHKRFGYILGSGFSMGKRGDVEETDDDDINIFVDENGNMYVLTEDLNGPAVAPTDSEDSLNRVLACDGEVVPYFSESLSEFEKRLERYMSESTTEANPAVQHYFTDGLGNDFVLIDDITDVSIPLTGKERGVTFYGCTGNVKELLPEDLEDLDEVSNRNFDEKRSSSWKRFGHILGRGFSFGK